MILLPGIACSVPRICIILPYWIRELKGITTQISAEISVKTSQKRWQCAQWWCRDYTHEMQNFYPFMNSETGRGV